MVREHWIWSDRGLWHSSLAELVHEVLLDEVELRRHLGRLLGVYREIEQQIHWLLYLLYLAKGLGNCGHTYFICPTFWVGLLAWRTSKSSICCWIWWICCSCCWFCSCFFIRRSLSCCTYPTNQQALHLPGPSTFRSPESILLNFSWAAQIHFSAFSETFEHSLDSEGV